MDTVAYLEGDSGMMEPLTRATMLRVGTAIAALAFGSAAQAQGAGSDSRQDMSAPETARVSPTASDTEIVVTARRRREVLQDVPIAITAFSGEQLEQQGALDLTDIGDTTPNVTLETSRGTNTTLTAFIRGVGQQDPVAGFEQGVGIYVDDVYLNRPQLALLDIYDVERIEVLRGPQGTLYGRNTIGGAIKYVTRRLSDEPEARVRLNFGTYEQADLVVSASMPLANGLRVGAAGARLSRGGFGDNLTTGEENYNKDIWAARGTIEIEPSSNVFFRLAGDYTWDNSNERGGHRLLPGLLSNAPVLANVFDTRGGINDPEQEVKGGGIAGRLDISLRDGLMFRSITAYREDQSIGRSISKPCPRWMPMSRVFTTTGSSVRSFSLSSSAGRSKVSSAPIISMQTPVPLSTYGPIRPGSCSISRL